MLPIRNISYLLPMCCSFWEKCKNSQKTGLGCSTPLILATCTSLNRCRSRDDYGNDNLGRKLEANSRGKLPEPRGGGHSTFFQVGVCGPDSRSGGLANWHLPLKRGACERKISKFGGLWAENFQVLGACELKISKFGGLWAKIWVKIVADEAKISKFSQKGVLWTDSFAWNGTLVSGRRGVKRGSSGPNIPIPPF